MNAQTPVTEIKGIGEKTAKLYSKLGIGTAGDLLAHFPKNYECFDPVIEISKAKAGETCSVCGSVAVYPTVKKIRNLTVMTCYIKDRTGSMQLTFFNMGFLQKVLKPGMVFVFRGTVQARGPALLMEQPKYYGRAEYQELLGKLQPRYALTKGLTNSQIQKSVGKLLENYTFEEEYLPEAILREEALPKKQDAIYMLHLPESIEEAALARKRLVFDEFFFFLLLMRKNKDLVAVTPNEYKMIETGDTVRFLQSLPYELTKGQKRTWQEIREDLEGPVCMNRLVQGDVGSGKTVIAKLALLMTAANGYQGALMAPTEVLAIQHYEGVLKDCEEQGVCFKPILLVGSMSAKEKKAAREKIASGEANLIIGTHALIQESVQYKNLALVVTDEQHRFGVRQREKLAEKNYHPHILVMSATPIPRTLAIILYGDLQISVIKELPAERLPIKNCVVGTAFRSKAYSFIADQVSRGHQAYVICPQVEEGESEDLENVVEYADKLRSQLPPEVIVAHLHGRMKAAEKNEIMEAFGQGRIHVLVSTTVIEVGINVPNATVMMVENAERFGLAQLHQLRGRVGRGQAQSYCIFISTKENRETMERLEILNSSNDGFHIASEDMRLRGPGDLFGIRQSGDFSFRIGDIYQDSELLKEASRQVDLLLKRDPGLDLPEHRALSEHIRSANAELVDFRTI